MRMQAQIMLVRANLHAQQHAWQSITLTRCVRNRDGRETLPGKSTCHTRFRHRARSSRYMLEEDLQLPLALERYSVRSRLAESVFILTSCCSSRS